MRKNHETNFRIHKNENKQLIPMRCNSNNAFDSDMPKARPPQHFA